MDHGNCLNSCHLWSQTKRVSQAIIDNNETKSLFPAKILNFRTKAVINVATFYWEYYQFELLLESQCQKLFCYPLHLSKVCNKTQGITSVINKSIPSLCIYFFRCTLQDKQLKGEKKLHVLCNNSGIPFQIQYCTDMHTVVKRR